jgi:hypothetical protein
MWVGPRASSSSSTCGLPPRSRHGVLVWPHPSNGTSSWLWGFDAATGAHCDLIAGSCPLASKRVRQNLSKLAQQGGPGRLFLVWPRLGRWLPPFRRIRGPAPSRIDRTRGFFSLLPRSALASQSCRFSCNPMTRSRRFGRFPDLKACSFRSQISSFARLQLFSFSRLACVRHCSPFPKGHRHAPLSSHPRLSDQIEIISPVINHAPPAVLRLMLAWSDEAHRRRRTDRGEVTFAPA